VQYGSQPDSAAVDPQLQLLIDTFDDCFADSLNTRLLRGESEPIYLPADQHCPYHRVIFAHGFFASAMHEIAHWCIAGEQRRQRVDYGYWYEPDGRSAEQQHLFEQVEYRPQALEWIFMYTTGRRFRVSVDNLSGQPSDPEPFKDAVYRQVLRFCESGLSVRQEQFRRALATSFGGSHKLCAGAFRREELG
jgi:elongation factor P hydroxylase